MPAATKKRQTEIEGASHPMSSVFTAMEALTKGIEIPLPAGNSVYDKYGSVRGYAFAGGITTQEPTNRPPYSRTP